MWWFYSLCAALSANWVVNEALSVWFPLIQPAIQMMIPSSASPMPELTSLGRRIAALRSRAGLTQQELAERVAISRVALSNLESGRSVPGERTVTLLAGVFDLEPHDLVDGSDYPTAKAERLPQAAARYTRAELLSALCERDLSWLEGAPALVAEDVARRWRHELREAIECTCDRRERAKLQEMLDRL